MRSICLEILLCLKSLPYALQQAVELLYQRAHLIRQIMLRHGRQILGLTQGQLPAHPMHGSQ